MLNKWFIVSFLWQLTFFIVAGIAVNYALDEKSGFSAFLGGLTYIVPSFLANLYMHKTIYNNEHAVVGRAYMSNIYKLIMTAAALIYIFTKVEIHPAVFIVSFCVASVVQVVTSFLSINRE